jgi:ATP-dependent exoDNAse (exonuclease V) alpha subunit
VPLTLVQAYTLRHCQRGSTLYETIHQDWKLYSSADEATVEKYQHLFATKFDPKKPFVTFQQAVLKDKVDMLTAEEQTVLEEFIDTRFQADTDLRERPWRALKTDNEEPDGDLERQYVKE